MSEEGRPPVPMRVPAHGRGQLRVGNPRNRGRSRSEVREAALAGAHEAVPFLRKVLRERGARRDKIAAATALLRFGLEEPDWNKLSRGEFRALVVAMWNVVEDLVQDPHALATIRERWLAIVTPVAPLDD